MDSTNRVVNETIDPFVQASTPVLVPLSSLTEEHLAEYFKVKLDKFDKFVKHKVPRIISLHEINLFMESNGIASFKVDGPVNVFSCSSVEVLNHS